MIYGYARVSAVDQNLGTQMEQLKHHGCGRIYQDKITGIAKHRPQFDELMKVAKEGDTIVVTRIDRLGRDTLQMLQLIEELNERGVRLEILNLPFDANNSMGKALMQVAMVFAQLERDMLKEKQRAGIELAKKQGKYKGRIRKYTAKHAGMNHAIELKLTTNKTVEEICQITGVSRAALYRELKQRDSTKLKL